MSSQSQPSSWMDKILGIFGKKASPQEMARFTSAVEEGNVVVAMKIWPKVSSEDQSKAFSYCASNDKREVLLGMLQKIPAFTVFKEIQSHMDPRSSILPEMTRWLIKNVPPNLLHQKQWCELSLTAAFNKQSEILQEIYTHHSGSITPYLSSQKECQSMMDELRPVISQHPPYSLYDARAFEFALGASACLGHDAYLSLLLPLADNYDLYQSHKMLLKNVQSTPVTPGVMKCFIALLPKDTNLVEELFSRCLEANSKEYLDVIFKHYPAHKLVEELFSGCLEANSKEYLDVLFKHYPSHKFKMHDFYIGIHGDNQEQFDLVFNRVDWVTKKAREVVAQCVEYDRQYMFDCLLPKAISSKAELDLALLNAAKNNNVGMAQKMLSPQWLPHFNPRADESHALQVACACGSSDVFDLLYPHSDPEKALKSLQKDMKSSTSSLPHNTDLLINYDTRKALTSVLQQTEAVPAPQRKKRM